MDLSESDAKTMRKIVKAAATRLKTYIESEQAEGATKFELAERRRKLANLFEQYDEIQSRIECLTADADPNILAAQAEDRA